MEHSKLVVNFGVSDAAGRKLEGQKSDCIVRLRLLRGIVAGHPYKVSR